jgi:hypothetical protein
VLPSNCILSLGLGINDAADNDPLQGNMTAFSASAKLALISDGADTRVATIIGVNAAGTPVPVSETVTLNGAAEVLSVGSWSQVWAVFLATTDGARTVTFRQGSGGTIRGTIGIGKIACWLWVVSPGSKAAGITLPNLAAGQTYGMWRSLSWAAGVPATRPNSLSVRFEEGA